MTPKEMLSNIVNGFIVDGDLTPEQVREAVDTGIMRAEEFLSQSEDDEK